jgi:galactoside O-acetyltransferase
MPGVTLGEGAAVGAISLVTSSLPPWTISVGQPARPVKARGRAMLDKELVYRQALDGH